MPRRLVFSCWLLCSLFAAAWPGRAADAPASLSKDRAALVLVGVAGDVESEKAFADQLDRLLDALSAPDAAPKSLTLLVENPAAFADRKLPFPLKVLPNRRTSLLSLKGTDPDLVIAWGHGGQQGAQAVLHVPGPRVMPPDLLALVAPAPASSTAAKPTDWILYFRGSRAFAEALSSPARRVLASEGEKTFTYDPTGLPLLVQAFPRAADLPALTALTAKAVDQWYASRSLVATEQPTLWREGQPVPADDLKSAAGTSTAATASNPSKTPFVANASQVLSAAMRSAWRGPAPVDPAAYPDADAVVLRESVQAVIGDNPQLSQEEERFVQILTPEGKRFGDLDLAFSPPEENLTIIDCEVRQPDGRVEPVDTGAHDEAPSPNGPPEEFPAARRKFFSVPNVAPGAILHLRQRREWKHFPLPKVYLALPLADELPIVEKNLEIRVPASLPFRFAWKNPPAGAMPDPKVERSAYGSIYRWHFGAVAPLPTDPLQPPDREPALLASTFGDWAEFLAWYQGIIRESARPTPEMTAKAQELTRNCTDDLDKIRALFRYVTELRYVAVPIGVNAYRPHAAANVFHHRYGDCKDKANLLNALLTSQGFDARLVLAPRFAVALPEVPGAAFNHAISHVNLGGKSLWLDSTDDICRFGLLPPGDPGRRVLLIADKEKELRTLPLPTAQESRLELTRTLTLNERGAIKAESDCHATGILDYQLRGVARRFGGSKAHVNIMDGLVKPVIGAETLNQQKFLSPAEMGQDFSWKAESGWDGLSSPLPTGRGRFVRVPFGLPAEWAAALPPRTAGLYLNLGYPCEIIQRITLRLQDSDGKPKLPAGGEWSDGGPLKCRLQWTQWDPAAVVATLTITLTKADLSPAEALVFQQQLRLLHELLAQGVLIERKAAAQP